MTYEYLVTGETKLIRENGVGALANFYHDDLGARVALALRNGTVTYYDVDPISRLAAMTHDLAGNANDLTIGGIAYNPASQIVSQWRSNDGYAWTAHANVSRPDTTHGLTQITATEPIAPTYDRRGKLTRAEPTAGPPVYAHDGLNRRLGRIDQFAERPERPFLIKVARTFGALNKGDGAAPRGDVRHPLPERPPLRR